MTEGRPGMSSETTESNSSATKAQRRRRSRHRSEGPENQNDSNEMDQSEPILESSGGGPPKTIGRTKSAERGNIRSSRVRSGEASSEGSLGADSNDQNEVDRRQSFRDTGKDDSSGRSFLEQLSVMADDPGQNQAQSYIRKFRLFCGKIVEDPRVQLSIIILIVLNAILMGVATFDFVTDDPEVETAFEKTDRVFLVIFTAELALQLTYRSISFFSDSWLIFDFVIVVVSWSLEQLQIVRAFRIFRAFRLVTRIGPLRELVMAIGAVMPRMYAIAMLLFLIFYIFAVLFTELFSELTLSDNYFGSLDVSLFTCMEMMTLEWADTTREVMEHKKWAWAPLLAFISVTGFIVFNLIVAVVCDAVAVVDREAMAEKHPELLTDKQKLEEAQERIWELTETVEILMMRQERLLSVADMLAKEVRTAVMSPAAAAAASPSNPTLRSAMKNSVRSNNGSNTPGEPSQPDKGVETVLHFSDEEEDDEEHPSNTQGRDGREIKKEDSASDSLENDVKHAIDRITVGRAAEPDHSGSAQVPSSNKATRSNWKGRGGDPPQQITPSVDGSARPYLNSVQ